MIPKYRMWNRITLTLHHVEGLYFDNKEVQYIDEVGILRFIKFKNTILMQSTGLHDKNGKELFEGDILAVETDEEVLRVSVFWNQNHALFMFASKKYNEVEALAELLEDNSYPFEIIGNIYENSELLENS